MTLKLFKIERTDGSGYDTYENAVVCCQSAEIARHMHPGSGEVMVSGDWGKEFSGWCSHPDFVKVTYLGEADNSVPIGSIVSAFNAG